MTAENLWQFVADGLSALEAGGRVTAAANDETLSAVTDPELRSVLTTGSDALRAWTARVDRALGEVGATGEGENPILEAHIRVAKEIRDAAPDDQIRDLGSSGTRASSPRGSSRCTTGSRRSAPSGPTPSGSS